MYRISGIIQPMKMQEKSLSEYRENPEFINYPDGFSIDEYEIDKPEWTEGFFTF